MLYGTTFAVRLVRIVSLPALLHLKAVVPAQEKHQSPLMKPKKVVYWNPGVGGFRVFCCL